MGRKPERNSICLAGLGLPAGRDPAPCSGGDFRVAILSKGYDFFIVSHRGGCEQSLRGCQSWGGERTRV